MKLCSLLKNYIETNIDIDILGISSDSRNIVPGNLFLAFPGEENDGREYIDNAVENGASAVLAEKISDRKFTTGVPVFYLKNLRDRVGEIAAEYYRRPSENIQVIGVTGTNGKTSTCFYIAQILIEMGIKTAVIGTTGYGIPNKLREIQNTTPGPVELQKIFYELKKSGIKVAVMEVSSHALAQQRVSSIKIDAAVYTNLTQDHLDYHIDIDRYANAKKMLFDLPSVKFVSINIDDGFGRKLFYQLKEKKQNFILYSAKNTNFQVTGNYITAENIKLIMEGLTFKTILNKNESAYIKTVLLGHFNVSNILAAISVLSLLGYDFNKVTQACNKLKAVPGRMQVIRADSGKFPVSVVDYAHTPDALENALLALKKQCRKRLICVFGCGGNRDRTKRPMMARAAEKYSDIVVVTNDNPRYENPDTIIDDIKKGFLKKQNIVIKSDRKQAIQYALNEGNVEDIVLIAGKGHEDYQIIDGFKLHFSDAETVYNYIN
ncbi:MAG: UDP-N-acetylmuramoyl-L-alanyl-D-glutamate--2,6-diaminopimelate ligase [Victivallales bacterium]|nr:UDP-N-acetylmuramoyl-L-alanyl-D-glutamate--2,6-diaminopimelate ligase [Victivallales bacterium]